LIAERVDIDTCLSQLLYNLIWVKTVTANQTRNRTVNFGIRNRLFKFRAFLELNMLINQI